ncbi:unnamed protein product [Spirodela intermedia]|uniref:RING-type domain-containing protein n=1 Tax=Spirodela intermedia TaxID=51605 RepID=A0A7I8IV61_SPIIN|nr:unnamed protein product [Spirodela intermedia]CAA6661698.1 unnamed protein product [Spirodela intermedia]
MGFDNECILNIQSLPGEYFCPVCRTLVYPNEALQTPCTHLFCKPCLAYIVATTSACPYDGYLVSEADAKPLVESNKLIAEAIEKIQVHCLYHRSGCQWQGTLSECITHCTSCTFGNSPVVCNRCGAQIVHRQVQEHAQICPGVQPQAQQADDVQPQASAVQNQGESQPVALASQESSSQPVVSSGTPTPGATTAAAVATSTVPTVGPTTDPAATAVAPAGPVQDQGQPSVASQPQVVPQVPTQEQWYQQYQQYQQYYQQYPGFDPYQQQYQQYGYYQQQVQQQYPQAYGQSHPVQGQQHSQVHAQQHPQTQHQAHPQQVQQQYPQAYGQSHPVQGQQHPQVHGQQHPQTQPQAHPQQLSLPQVQSHSHNQTVPVGQQPQTQALQSVEQPIHAQIQQQQMHPSTQSQVLVQPMGQQQSQIPQLQPHSFPHGQPPHLQHQPRPQQQQQMVGQNQPGQPQQQPPNAQSHPNFHGQTQSRPPAQQPRLHMQSQPHPRPHSISQPPLQSQLQTQAQSQSLHQPHPLHQAPPQSQLHHLQGQPQPQPHPQPQPQLHTAPAHTVTGHQSFPQPHLQPQMAGATAHQRPMHLYPLQHGVPQQQHQHPSPMPNQFPHQQPPQSQMRPPQSQMPVQGQQLAPISSMQGPHQHFPPGQQQAHHLPHLPHLQVHNQVRHPPNIHAPQHPNVSHQQPQTSSHHNQVHPLGSFPPQPHIPTQHNLRPPGQLYLQQPLNQPQLQPASQTIPQPVLPNHALAHQEFKLSPGGLDVRSRVSSENPTADPRPPLESGGQESALPSSPASLKPFNGEKEADANLGKTALRQFDVASDKTDDVSEDSKILNAEAHIMDEENEDKVAERVDKENAGYVADEEGSASVQNDDVSEAKTFVKDDVTGSSEHSPNRVSLEHNDGEKKSVEVEGTESKSDGGDKNLMVRHGQVVDSAKFPMHDDTSRNLPSQVTAEKAPHQLAHQESTNSGEKLIMQGPRREPIGAPPAHDRAIPGYPDRNVPVFPSQGPSSGDPRQFPPPAQMQPNSNVVGPHSHPPLLHGQERYLQQAPPPGPHYTQDISSQRPPAPERMLPKQMPYLGPKQERLFQEPTQGIPPHGQPLASSQMRPSLMSFNPDPLQTSLGKHPPGGFPGSHSSLGRGPPSFVPPVGSQLQSQGFVVPSHDASGMSRISQVEPYAGIPMSGPPAGSFGTAAAMNGRGPPTHSFPHGKQPAAQSSVMAMNGLPGRADPSLSQAAVGERFISEERYKSMADEGFRPSADDHFRPYVDPVRRVVDRRDFEEDLKQGAKFGNYATSSMPLDRSSRALGLDGASRSFDRGMQAFGQEGAPRIRLNSPVSSRSVPLYKSGGPLPVNSDSSSMRPMENMERQRSFDLSDDHSGRKGDTALPNFHRPGSDFGRHRIDSLHLLRSPGIELSGLPPNRFGSIAHGLVGRTLAEDFVVRDLPASGELYYLRMGNQLGSGNMPGMRVGDLDGRDMMPSQMRSGDPLGAGAGSFHNHLPVGELAGLENVPPHLYSRDFSRFGDFPPHDFPNEPRGLSSVSIHFYSFERYLFMSGSFQGGQDPLDNSRKRKQGSIGWCRICKVDCETVEGLDLHSQTTEHQKRAMDIVLSIKQDNAKKQKLSSEEHEESNKSRKAGFEGRPSRR